MSFTSDTRKPAIIKIGSDAYYLGNEKTVELGIKSKEEYVKAFGSDSETERLLRKYFPYGSDWKKQGFKDLRERGRVLDILKKRRAALEESKAYMSNTLSNARVHKYAEEIGEIIRGIEELSKPAVNVEAAARIEKIEAFSPEEQFQTILEMAWYVMHPDKMDYTIRDNWTAIVEQMSDRLRVGNLVDEIKKDKPIDVDLPDDALNYFKRINMSNVVRTKTVENSLLEAKKEVLENKREKLIKGLQDRLKNIVMILKVGQYINDDGVGKIMNNMNSNSYKGVYTDISNSLVPRMAVAMNPVFTYMRKVYDPIYSYLEGVMKNSIANSVVFPMDKFMKLLHICNSLDKKEYIGVMRIDGLGELVPFLEFANKEYDRTIKEKQDESIDKLRQFRGFLNELPFVRLRSRVGIPGYSPTTNVGNYICTASQFDKYRRIEYMESGKNSIFAKVKGRTGIENKPMPITLTEVEKDINEFFKEDSIFLINGTISNFNKVGKDKDVYPIVVPIKLFTLNEATVTMTSPITKIISVDNYISSLTISAKPEEFLSISDIFDRIKRTYNNTALALMTLISFKEQLPKV